MWLAGGVAPLVRWREPHERGHLLGRAEPAHGLAVDKSLAHLCLRFLGLLGLRLDAAVERRRMNGAGADRVRPDALADEIGGHRLGEPDDRGLGGPIDIAVGHAADRGYRRR